MQSSQSPIPGTSASTPALAIYTSVANFQAQEAGEFFETRASLDWFIKRHRQELVEAGALIPRDGRAGSLVHRELFPKAVVSILRRVALERPGK